MKTPVDTEVYIGKMGSRSGSHECVTLLSSQGLLEIWFRINELHLMGCAMIFNTALEYVNHALLLAKDRCARNPQFPTYTSVINQLIYVKAVFEGVEKDKSRLHDLSLGALGAKEFEDTDYELARAIMDVSYIASQSANGLKVKLPTGILYQDPFVKR